MSNLEFLSFTKENKAKYLKNISMVLIPDEEFTGSILINKEKDELIGFGYLDTGYTNNVYIEPKYRHKGYGTLIMDQIMTKFKGNKIRVPKSLNLLDFYKKVGFTYVKQDSEYYYFDCPKGYLVEDTRTAQLNKSKEKGLYKNAKYGKNRYERKKYSKLASTVEEYNKIDMNDFFKKDILLVKIPITGETDNYTVKVKLLGVVAEMTKSIKSNKYKFEFKTVLQALTKVFNTTDVYTNCTCDDYKYHFAYWNIVNNVSIDDSAHNPGPGKGIANPDDDKGRGCKHILLVLENCDWLMKVASVIFNYVEYMSNKMPEVFLSVIFPRLYGIDAEEAQEQNIIPYNVDLKTAKDLVNIINKQSINPVKREEKEDEEE